VFSFPEEKSLKCCLGSTVGDTVSKLKTTYEPTATQFLYLRKPIGIFYARLYQRGGSKWISLKTKVRSIAKTKLAQLLTKHHETRNARRDVEAGSATVGQLAKVYMESQNLRTDIRQSTKDHRKFIVISLLQSWPELAEKLPSKVTEYEVAEWAARHHADWSPTKHNAAIDSLKGIFKIAIDRGVIGTNPAAKLIRAKVKQKRLELPSSAQFNQIVQTIRTSGASSAKGNGDLVEFLAYSGCRINEASRVKWKDIDEVNNRIWIEPGKSGHGRHVPTTPAMTNLLKRIRDEKRWVLANPKRRGYVLINVSCEESLESACEKAGVQRMTHHSLRHLFATRAIESAVPVPTVARWLGHQDGGALLLRTYSPLLDAHSQEMAGKVSF
jgi:integrase